MTRTPDKKLTIRLLPGIRSGLFLGSPNDIKKSNMLLAQQVFFMYKGDAFQRLFRRDKSISARLCRLFDRVVKYIDA